MSTVWKARRACAFALALLSVSASAGATEPLSVVALGNSLTLHGPAPAIGWHGNWGMAASSEQRDYVARLGQLLRDAQAAEVRLARWSFGALELQPDTAGLDEAMRASTRASQLFVVELGDNVKPANVAAFGRAYARMLAEARPARGVLLCLSTWWRSAATDAAIEAACRSAGGSFVAIGDIFPKLDPQGPATRPGQTDPGVLAHPSDVGMAEIAARLFARWQKLKPGKG
jgi:alpha-galactosidase